MTTLGGVFLWCIFEMSAKSYRFENIFENIIE